VIAGYSKRVAKEQAAENLTKPHVRQAIQERVRPRLMKLGITLDHTLEECRRLAYGRVGDDFEDQDGEYQPISEWPQEHTQTALQFLSLKHRPWRMSCATSVTHGSTASPSHAT
jgi:phage terminase small subunit